jgi:cell division protein FtsB
MSVFNKTPALWLTLGAVAVALGLVLLYSNQGLLRLKRLDQERLKIEKANQALEEENRRLLIRIDRTKHDPGTIEDEARRKLGLIKPDEIIFQFKSNKRPAIPPNTSPSH